jgi:hypothetical protein
MTLVKENTIIAAPKNKKPTRFRFKGNLRLGFRRNEVVEIVEFKRKNILKKRGKK